MKKKNYIATLFEELELEEILTVSGDTLSGNGEDSGNDNRDDGFDGDDGRWGGRN